MFRKGEKLDTDDRPLGPRVRARIARIERSMRAKKFIVKTERFPDGSTARITINMRGRKPVYLSRARVPSVSDDTAAVARFLWMPEGFVFTPKTDEAPLGYGFPKRDADAELINEPWGTADGVLRECLLNRFANNGYEPGEDVARVIYVPLPFTEADFDLPGVEGVLQFLDDERFQVFAEFEVEPKTEGWHAHFPEELTYSNAVAERIFKQTNALRAESGLDALFRPIRGNHLPADAVAVEITLTGSMHHDSLDYREGYRLWDERTHKDGWAVNGAENLAFFPTSAQSAKTPDEQGDAFVDGWSSSPGHLANMVQTEWNKNDPDVVEGSPYRKDTGTVLGVSESGVTITETDEGPITPQASQLGVQVFTKREKWVYHGDYYWSGDEGRLSWSCPMPDRECNPYAVVRIDPESPGVFPMPTLRRQFVESDGSAVRHDAYPEPSSIFLHGRRYDYPGTKVTVGDLDNFDEDYGVKVMVLGAALRRWDGELYVVAAVLDREEKAIKFTRAKAEELERRDESIAEERAANALEGGVSEAADPQEWETYAEKDLSGAFNVSLVRFSQNGRKAIFKIESVAGTPSPYRIIYPYTGDYDGVAPYLTDWLTDEVPHDPLKSEFWELDQVDGLEVIVLNEITAGVSLRFEWAEGVAAGTPHYKMDPSGEFPVAKDYKDNELVSLRAIVDDHYYYGYEDVLEDQEFLMEQTYKRKLVFPSGKEFWYCDIDLFAVAELDNLGYVTPRECTIACLDYVDVANEDVAGLRVKYRVQEVAGGGGLTKKSFIFSPVTIEHFVNDTVLYSERTTDGSVLPFLDEHAAIFTDGVRKWPIPGLIGDFYMRRYGVVYQYDTADERSPEGFIPFDVHYNAGLLSEYIGRETPNGTEWFMQLDAPPYPQQVDYGSRMFSFTRSFPEALGFNEVTINPLTSDSKQLRAWSIVGPGFGHYNPNPCLGSSGQFGMFRYDGEQIAAGANDRQHFKRWGSGTNNPDGTDADTSTLREEREYSHYDSSLDITEITGLEVKDDLFPLGVI